MPTKFRDAFAAVGNAATITRHPDGCLVIFPRDRWDEVAKQFEVMAMSDLWVKRMFYGHATDVEMDKSGRVLVAPELRETVGMRSGGELKMFGMATHIELWDRDSYQSLEQAGLAKEASQEAQKRLVY
jgi:MraZ protein